jgi:hypothetical protein
VCSLSAISTSRNGRTAAKRYTCLACHFRPCRRYRSCWQTALNAFEETVDSAVEAAMRVRSRTGCACNFPCPVLSAAVLRLALLCVLSLLSTPIEGTLLECSPVLCCASTPLKAAGDLQARCTRSDSMYPSKDTTEHAHNVHTQPPRVGYVSSDAEAAQSYTGQLTCTCCAQRLWHLTRPRGV